MTSRVSAVSLAIGRSCVLTIMHDDSIAARLPLNRAHQPELDDLFQIFTSFYIDTISRLNEYREPSLLQSSNVVR